MSYKEHRVLSCLYMFYSSSSTRSLLIYTRHSICFFNKFTFNVFFKKTTNTLCSTSPSDCFNEECSCYVWKLMNNIAKNIILINNC